MSGAVDRGSCHQPRVLSGLRRLALSHLVVKKRQLLSKCRRHQQSFCRRAFTSFLGQWPDGGREGAAELPSASETGGEAGSPLRFPALLTLPLRRPSLMALTKDQ